MATIYHQVLIQADKNSVYQALTTQDSVAKWWLAACVVKPEVGFVNEFGVPGMGINKMKVTALQSGALVAWKCLNEADAWTGTTLTFTLTERGAYTCLDFKHAGYAEQDEVYATCNYHWARHLFMLKHLCETGTSLLDPEAERREVEAVHGK